MPKTLTIQKPDGSVRTISGYKAGKPAPSAKKYSSSRESKSSLPPKIDLRKLMTPIESQGFTNSCVANAVAGAYEYLLKQHWGEDAYDVSRLFIYYNARYLENEETVEDEGAYVSLAIEGLKEYGACGEQTWDYEEDLVNEEPSDEAYQEAASFLIEDVYCVPLELEAWKNALAEGYPIIFGIATFQSFDAHRKPGLVPAPTKNESSRESHEGHAMLCVGYSDKDQVFIVRNSWGQDWGDKGYCYIPYRYMMNRDYNDGDSWIIRRVDEIEFNEEDYYDDEESVLGDYESELANMSDEQYEEMLDAMGEYPLEFRLALLFIHAANAEDDFGKAEEKALNQYMQHTFEVLGSEYDAKDVLKYCWEEHAQDEELVEESVGLLGEFLSTEMLATIINDLEEIVSSDEMSEEEESFIDHLVEAWEIEYE